MVYFYILYKRMSSNESNAQKNSMEKFWVKNQLEGYEKEKFWAMKDKFANIIKYMGRISSDLEEADNLWILITT